MKPKKALESLTLTNHRVGTRTQIYINGYAVCVADACLSVIKILAKSNDFTDAKTLNADPSNIPRYVYRWESDFSDPARGGSSVLKDVKLFENNRAFGWRLAIKVEMVEQSEVEANNMKCKTLS